MSTLKVADIERALARRFPLEHAEGWDRCGLLAGDPDAVVTGVVLALDPTPEVIERCVELGANVLVTHHPAFLTPPQWLTPGRGAGATLFHALSAGVALINAHTNLDRDAAAQSLIPQRLGLTPVKPVERSLQPMSIVTVYVPDSAAEKVVAAMAGAGAGRIGDYERCSFAAAGTGSFTSPANANPAVGKAGQATVTPEQRIEMLAPSGRVKGVVSAAVAAHPYEEPLVTTAEVLVARNAARLGMVCDVAPASAQTLASLAQAAATAYGVTPRVWGDPATPVTRVATGTGSVGSLIGDAIAAGAQTLIGGEVRYHDAVDAVGAGLCVIELGHDVTEWPLVELLEDALSTVDGIDTVSVHRLPARAGWWVVSSDGECP